MLQKCAGGHSRACMYQWELYALNLCDKLSLLVSSLIHMPYERIFILLLIQQPDLNLPLTHLYVTLQKPTFMWFNSACSSSDNLTSQSILLSHLACSIFIVVTGLGRETGQLSIWVICSSQPSNIFSWPPSSHRSFHLVVPSDRIAPVWPKQKYIGSTFGWALHFLCPHCDFLCKLCISIAYFYSAKLQYEAQCDWVCQDMYVISHTISLWLILFCSCDS